MRLDISSIVDVCLCGEMTDLCQIVNDFTVTLCDSCVVPVSYINMAFLMGGGHNIWDAVSVKRKRNITQLLLGRITVLMFQKYIFIVKSAKKITFYNQICLQHIAVT